MIIGLFLLAVIGSVLGDSSTCISTVSSVPVSSTAESVISSAEVDAPSLVSIGTVISTVELSSPSLVMVESIIESYEQSYSNVISEIESIYDYPSLYSDESAACQITTAFSTLASAISLLVSAEATHSALAEYQSTLQSLEVYYSSILTDLSSYTDAASPTVYLASGVISAATLVDSSILASVIAVSTAVSTDSSVSYAISYLSYDVYYLPSTIVTEILTVISSPSTVAASTVAILEECYPTVYTELTLVTAFTYSYPSVVTDLTDYLSAAASVSGLGSAASTIVYYQMPTLYFEVSVLSSAEYSVSSLTDDLQILNAITAESPTLHNAEETLEGSFYSSPSEAYSIYVALDYPQLVTAPSAISVYEESHESLVSAIDYIISWESYYSSYASTLASVDYALTDLFSSYRTLLTAYSYVQDITSPSMASASAVLSSVKLLVSDITYVLSGVASITDVSPSLSCAESVVEYYAEFYPSAASYIWSIDDGVSDVPASSFSYVDELLAAYPDLVEAESSIAYDISYYSSLATLEASFIYAAYSYSSLLTQYDFFSAGSSLAFSEFSSSSSSF